MSFCSEYYSAHLLQKRKNKAGNDLSSNEMTLIRNITCLMFGLFCLWSLPAHAQQGQSPISEQGAKTISTVLDGLLAPSYDSIDVNGKNINFHWQGETKTSLDQGAYLVTLPRLVVLNRHGDRYYWGDITIRLTPASLGAWSIEIDLPNSVTRYGKNGRRNGMLNIGQSFITGSFTPGTDAQFNLQAILDQFIISTVEGDIDSRIAKAKINFTLKSAAGGNWQANMTSDIAGLSWQRFDGRAPMKMKRGRIILAGDDLDLAGYIARKNQGTQPGKDLNHGIFGGLLKTFQLQLASDHLILPTKSSEHVINLQDFLVNLKLDGLNREFSNVSVGYRHKNMTTVPAKPNNEMSPKNLDFAFTAQQLPNKKIWQSVLTYLVDSETIGEEKASVNLRSNLKKHLAAAKSNIRLDNLRIEMPSTSALISGNLTFTNLSNRPFYGELSLIIRDLKKTWQILSQNQEASIFDKVGMEYVIDELAASGKEGRDARGNLVHAYKIKIDDKGKIKMNDTDISKYILQ